MKKRKILLGLALSAAVFGLAACTDAGQSGTNSSSAAATSEVASTSTPAATSAPAATSTPAVATSTAAPATASSSVAPVATSTAAPVASSSVAAKDVTVYVKYYAEGVTSALTDDVTVTIKEGQTLGGNIDIKSFDGYKYRRISDLDSFGGELTPETVIDAKYLDGYDDLTVYVVYEQTGMYDTLLADAQTDDNKKVIFNNDFVDTTLEVGSSFDSTTPTTKITAEAPQASVDGTRKLALKTANALCDFGGAKEEVGLYTMYFEVNFAGTQTEAFFQLDGTDDALANKEIFALRTNKNVLQYRIDGGADVSLGKTVTTKTTYKFLVEFDKSAGTISVTVDGEKVLDGFNVQIVSLNGLKFTCKSGGTSQKTIDNVIVVYEKKEKSPLVIAKETAVAELQALTLNTDETIKAAEEAVIENAIEAVNNADTTDAVTAAANVAKEYVAATKYVFEVVASDGAAAISNVTSLKTAYVAGETPVTAKSIFEGYAVEGFYTDAACTTAYADAAIAVNTTIYAKATALVNKSISLEFNLETDAETGKSTATFTNSAVTSDGTAGSQTDNGSTTKDAIQLQQKSSDSKDSNITVDFAESVTSATIALKGWTGGSSSASNYLEVIAYDSEGKVVSSVIGKTPTDKKYGDYETVTVSATTIDQRIDKIVIHCCVDGKSIIITEGTITYYCEAVD